MEIISKMTLVERSLASQVDDEDGELMVTHTATPCSCFSTTLPSKASVITLMLSSMSTLISPTAEPVLALSRILSFFYRFLVITS